MDYKEIRKHFDQIAPEYDLWKKKSSYYYSLLVELFTRFIPPGETVLDLGCGTGEILNAVRPKVGIGIDFSDGMIKSASRKFPRHQFFASMLEHLAMRRYSGYVIMADVFDHVPDIWAVISELNRILEEGSTVVISTINPLWDPILKVAEKMKLKMPEGPHNFVLSADILNLLRIFDFSILEEGYVVFLPKRIPLISDILNKLIPRIPFLKRLCVVQYIVAKKAAAVKCADYSCSVIIPCYNEAGNIERCIRSIKNVGSHTEVIFVDDGSLDGTSDAARRLMPEFGHVKLISYSPNKGKGSAVRLGIEAAGADVVMIYDADLSVPAEELLNFMLPLENEKARFTNGTRMVYPMEDEAMRTLNLWGNKFFAFILSWLLGQRITDTLCGTKAFFKKDYSRMKIRGDKWGDFDFLLGAAELGLKIVEVPIHYNRRRAGVSKMAPFKHSLLLLKICIRGFFEIKVSRWLSRIKQFFLGKGRTTVKA